jgi:superfamily II DNA or RNA helicase
MAGIIANLGVKTLILEPPIELVSQNAKEIEQFIGVPVKIIRGIDSLSKTTDYNYDIYVASIDTLTSNFDLLVESEWFNQFECILGDEIHHATYTKEKFKRKVIDGKKKIVGRSAAGFTGYYQVFMACHNAYYRYGFTATDEEVEQSIMALTGNLLYEVSEDSLIESGRVSKPVIFIYYLEVPFYDNERDAFRYGIYENQQRNEILITAMKLIVENGGSVLFMLDSIKYQLNQIKDWTHFPVVTGETKLKDREIIYEKIRSGEEKGLIMTVAKEGLNLPAVDAIIRASGKKSVRLVVQEKGRGSRRTKDKNTYLVLDFYDDDKYKRVYNPLTGRYRTKKGYLSKHSDMRLDIYKKTQLAEINYMSTIPELKALIEGYFA